MLQMFFFFIMTMNSMIFMKMNHPLSMGLFLMIQTMLISLFSGSMTKMYWFSYTLFLIFMGGMLILFMYMTSLASNEMFKFNMNPKLFILLFFILLFFFLLMMNLDMKILNFNNKTFNNENFSFLLFNYTIEYKNNIMLNKMYNFPINLINILLVNYLFLTLIMVVKITNIYSGPLRPKF